MTTAVKGFEVLTPQVFISYAQENETVVDLIYDKLNEKGILCWAAHHNIAAGQNWPDEISKAISNSRVMIVVLSEHTQKSRYVGMEVTQATEENLTIIPFCIEKVSLAGGLKLLLGNYQWINAYPHLQDKGLDQLVMTLHRHLGKEPRKTFRLPDKNEEQPDYISDLTLKGWDIIKNENDCWEAYYKAYDLSMIHIPPGKFMMGADESDDEKPPHEVELDGYWIGKYEVTFAQYDRYCEETGKEIPGDEGWGRENRPVINVSWEDAGAYCRWLSQKTGFTFRLPTEAQWEKAARGSRGFKYPWGNDFDKNKCNSYESGLQKTMPVGSYTSGKSPYGCMDMAGNVWEWCADWYDKDYYKNSPAKNPQGPAAGSNRVLRGGSWFGSGWRCRTAFRNGSHPASRDGDVGFRLLRSL